MAICMSIETQARIVRVLSVLWEDFIEYHDTKYSARHLWKHGPAFTHAPSEVLLDFLTFCAQILIPDPVGDVQISLQDLGDQRAKQDDNRAMSWLAIEQLGLNNRRVIVVLDHEFLLNEVSVPLLQIVRTKQILHEIGHLLHYEHLFKSTDRYPLVAEAQPVHEAEAWWFCYSLLGLTVAQCAYEKKKRPQESGMPPIWRVLQMYSE